MALSHALSYKINQITFLTIIDGIVSVYKVINVHGLVSVYMKKSPPFSSLWFSPVVFTEAI